MKQERQAIRVGVVGLGFMGATHVAAWQKAGGDVRLVAVADPKASRREGKLSDVGGNAVADHSQAQRAFDPAVVRGFEHAEDLIGWDGVDVVSICTPTDSHVKLAIKALRAGKHVLVEKPVALDCASIRRLAEVEQEVCKICMPAMCIRYWPAYAWLRERIVDGSLGKLKSLSMQRLAAKPGWSPHFFSDVKRTGGALFDLHIHDADFILWAVGKCAGVSTTGGVDHVTTTYQYEGGPGHVVAEGGWDHHAGFAFRMRYIAIFEEATADYDLSREQALLLCRAGKGEAVNLAGESGYDLQVRALADAIRTKNRGGLPTMEESERVTALLLAEGESAQTKRVVGW